VAVLLRHRLQRPRLGCRLHPGRTSSLARPSVHAPQVASLTSLSGHEQRAFRHLSISRSPALGLKEPSICARMSPRAAILACYSSSAECRSVRRSPRARARAAASPLGRLPPGTNDPRHPTAGRAPAILRRAGSPANPRRLPLRPGARSRGLQIEVASGFGLVRHADNAEATVPFARERPLDRLAHGEPKEGTPHWCEHRDPALVDIGVLG
jgi:hypothetical protein